MLTSQATGTAQLTSGAAAEQLTCAELRKLRAASWRVVNHFALEDWDIDHVLVGPGGVIAVETKWSHRDWRTAQSRPWLNAAVDQAQANARTLRLWLKRFGVTDVQSVVFCRSANGTDRDALPAHAGQARTAQIIYGAKSAAAWRDELRSSPGTPARLTDDQADRV